MAQDIVTHQDRDRGTGVAGAAGTGIATKAMHVLVFNGNAEGLCALQQLRLAAIGLPC